MLMWFKRRPVALNISFHHPVLGGLHQPQPLEKLQRFDHKLNGFCALNISVYCVVLLSSFASTVLLLFLRIKEQKAAPLRQIPLLSFVSSSVIQTQAERK